ncbi:MAG: thiamine-phosphate kinase [Bacillota bacterium]
MGARISGGEFGLIGRTRQRLGRPGGQVVIGIGDDAAVLEPPAGNLLASVDMLVEGIHFDKRIITPWQLGWKALAVNVSDIAAMGGIPLYALVSIGLDGDVDDTYVDDIYDGMLAVARRFGVELVGGDTVSSPKALVIDVAIIGQADVPVTRAGARPGDLIAVTGCLGASAAGLEWLLRSRRAGGEEPQPSWAQELVWAHLEPVPRVREGEALSRSRAVTAMMDISDGLASEVNHIAEESGVGTLVHAADIPISKATLSAARALGRDPLDWALFGGEDYELVFTFPRDRLETVSGALVSLGRHLHVVGEVVSCEEGVRLVSASGESRVLARAGFDHFAAGAL